MKRPKAIPERLGGRERELIDAIFALGNQATAEEVRARLKDPPGDSSVRVMLARLEKKGFLKHRQEGLRYVYSATASPAAAKRTAFQRYVQTFFGGSRQEMLTALIKEESPWTDEELDALQAQIDRVRKERKGQS
jgi:predicted transcriptional regulator